MPPTPLTKTTRFIPQGTSKYYWTPTIAAATGIPTRAELDAGTDLTGEVAAVAGFTTTGDQVDVPDAQSRFTKRVPGSVNPEDSSMTFYGSKTGADASTFFTRDQTGYVVMLDSGDTSGRPAESFPVTVVSVAKQREITSAFQVVVAFSITSDPVTFNLP